MRIISGTAKGRKLYSPRGKSQTIRPTSDRAREALFSIIGTQVKDAVVLDLFSGTGSFGLEALSRGAKKVIFIDNNPEALQLLKKNISACLASFNYSEDNDGMIRVIRHDLVKGLNIFSPKLSQSVSFDLIFLDPPYSKGLALQLLKEIDGCQLLSENGLVVAEENKNEVLPDNFNLLSLVDNRKYGRNGFWFYRK